MHDKLALKLNLLEVSSLSLLFILCGEDHSHAMYVEGRAASKEG